MYFKSGTNVIIIIVKENDVDDDLSAYSVDNQLYLLAAKDNSAAIEWIEKLQV